MSFIALNTRRFAALAIVAALALVALPTIGQAEADSVSVTGTIEVAEGAGGAIAIVSPEARYVVTPAAAAARLAPHAGKTVTAQGTVGKDADGNSTLAVTGFEVAES
jgi:hypothetical protein